MQQCLFLKKTLNFRLSKVSADSILQDVAADILGVRPDLGWRNILVPVQQAKSIYSGVSEASRTFRAGPEEERQSAETR